LKLVLLLELPLPADLKLAPDTDPEGATLEFETLLLLPVKNPTLDIEVRRDEYPEVSAPVEETVRAGDRGGGESYMYWTPRFKSGMSAVDFMDEVFVKQNTEYMPPSMVSVSTLYLTKGVLGSVIFIRLSFWISVNARFSSSHCKLLHSCV